MRTLGNLRLATQFFSLIIVNLGFTQALKTGIPCPVFYCYGCPWALFACPIGTLQTATFWGPFPFYTIGMLGIFGLALGRTWCGWACPFGAVQDLMARIRRSGDIVSLPSIPWMKYASLVGILIAAWIAAETLFCKVCPAGSLFAAIPHRIANADKFDFGTFFYVHLITLAVALVLFYLFIRFWCRYLCPLGAILGLFNRVSIVKVKLDREKCDDCEQCLKVCPSNITRADDVGRSTDCTQCGKCIETCPTSAIQVAASIRS